MTDPIKITSLEAENVKRVRAVQLHPSATGLTIIGGNNNQGKTSLLDTIAWALGGDRFRPSMATREGSTIPPHIKVTLSNGLIVERRGKNSDLKVIDPSGSKAGQQLLNAFIEQLALDLPRFMQASDREKADTLLRIIGVGEQLAALERKEQEQYNERLAIGRIADQKAKYAKEQPYWPDAPDELISASDLIRQQQAILARNGENQSKRAMASLLEQQVSTLTARVDELHRQLQTAENELTARTADLATARKTAEQLVDESTEELERSIADIETINAKVRDNLNREKAEEDARAYQQQYDSLTAEIEQLREDKRALLDGAKLPLTLTSYSPCFRKEKGAHGIEERGIYRIHQFEKQEMIVVCKPEDSMDWYDKLWKNSVELFRSMEIPVRQLECCSGDLADLKVKSCDIEAWSPRQQKYFEVCSCSNLGDAQARRLRIRFKDENGKTQLAHTLNNTCVAPPRMLIAFLENHLQADGTVTIPEVLRPYMGGKAVLVPNKK